eukprot:359840_1
MNCIIYCKELTVDTWQNFTLSAKMKAKSFCHKSFEMQKMKKWLFKNKNIESQTGGKKQLVFGIMIKNLQLIDRKYEKNAKIITLSNFNYNKRYYKFQWKIERD